MAKKKLPEAKVVPETAELLEGVRCLVPSDPEGETLFPLLMSLLLPRYDTEGRLTRESGRLSITARGNAWFVRIDCPTEGYAADVHIASLSSALTDVEEALRTKRVVWIVDFAAQKRARQRLNAKV
jgi:hypothetical protein